MKPNEILKHTEGIATELRQRFDGDPKGELDCWVATAHQREAMVVQIYDALKLERRIPDQKGPEGEAVKLVRDTIGSVWAQETSHATLMDSLRKLDDPRWTTEGAQGSIEGLMTSWATSGGLLGTIARAAIGTTRVFNAAPPFTAHLEAESLLGFFQLSAELELTAGNGYRRIIELLEMLDTAGKGSGYGVIPEYEFATTLAEEHFHQAVFQAMQGWLKNDREIDALDVNAAAGQIDALAHEHLGVRNVRRLRASTDPSTLEFLESQSSALVSDGGVGDVLMRYGIDLQVAERPTG